MKRLIPLVFLLSLPLSAVGQQSGPAPSSDPLFFLDRPPLDHDAEQFARESAIARNETSKII